MVCISPVPSIKRSIIIQSLEHNNIAIIIINIQ